MTVYNSKNGAGSWVKDEGVPTDEAALIEEFEHWRYWLDGLHEGYLRPLGEMFPEIAKLTPMRMFAFASFLLDGPLHSYGNVDRHAEVNFLPTYAFEQAYRAAECPNLAAAWDRFQKRMWPPYLKETTRRPEVFDGELPF